ncbi:MAG: shikimate dehydrogenase [Alkalispirochaeta sp.]
MALNFKQDLTAVFGHPVAENPTQVMAEAAYVHHNLNWRYLTVEVLPEDLPAAVAGARAMGFGGFNLTIPHKVAVIPHLDGLGESAEVIGAVNCVVRRGDTLIGENTDGRGFLESLREIINPSGVRVTVIGAGGAARAIVVELALAGAASVTIINRSDQRAAELVEYLHGRLESEITRAPWSDAIPVPPETDVLINATSIGLYPDVSGCPPIDFDTLSSSTVVADVIPNPPHTPFLRRAEERGCRTIDGLGMLINQGRIGIKYWTGVDPEPTVMRDALERVFTE